jgi:hypothetical protein
MSGRRQGRGDRLRRLAMGRCPVHGVCMPQTDGYFDDGTCYVECCRKDCAIGGMATDPHQVWLLPQWVHLLDGEPS